MSDQRPILTTRQGHPVRDNQSTRTVGERGPATLENYQFIEKITHFDRERIPERVVHARGAAAHGVFRSNGKASKISKAGLFAEGKETRVIDGRHYVLESPIHADFALIKALRGDRWGNLVSATPSGGWLQSSPAIPGLGFSLSVALGAILSPTDAVATSIAKKLGIAPGK